MSSPDVRRDWMLARAVSLNVLGQFGGVVIASVSAFLLARLLGPEDRGLLAIITTVAVIGTAVVGGGLPTAVQYFASRKETAQRALLGNSLLLGAAFAVVALPLFWLLRGPLGDAFA